MDMQLKSLHQVKTNKVRSAMFIKARKARSCSCQSRGNQLVAVVNFPSDGDNTIGSPCQGRSERGERAAGRRSTRSKHAVTQSFLTRRRERCCRASTSALSRYVSYIETSLTGNS
ncbi:jg23438 [Pararge aegeria aegeria]|uniref:Jg23438 protein n=1 Tax=Pararge aegeria aegeria TaxID=348720 RepID=A0A8S4S3Y3_9NEOP|nr:jg23438 [Pararge aegeria aegeria]